MVLVIIDLNRVLAKKEGKSFFRDENVISTPTSSCWRLRSDWKSCIDFLSTNYELAIWTSTTRIKAQPLVNHIEKYMFPRKLLFVKYREDTPLDPLGGHETLKTIKSLNLDIEKVLIIDDTPSKVRFNEEKDTLIVNFDVPFKEWIPLIDCKLN